MRRRRASLFFTGVVVLMGVVAVGLSESFHDSPPLPSTPVRARIVTIAEGQLGYRTDPGHSYCNKFSAFWSVGAPCGGGLRAEEWCADFAAWVWRKAGAEFTFSFTTGDINSRAASFYQWAVAHGTWHPAGAGYRPQPGDVAVYGLDVTTGIADHVAVVTGYTLNARGPNVVNGDGDRTGFSVVEAGDDQVRADAPGGPAPLSGYASPVVPPPAASGRPQGS